MRGAMREPFSRKINGRIRFLLAALLAWALILTGRLVQLQVFRHAAAKAEVQGQSLNKRDIPPERGTIFDRNGRILARSIPARSLFLTQVKGEPESALGRKLLTLKQVLGLDDDDIRGITKRVRRGDSFVYLKRKVSPELASAVGDLSLSGVYSHPESVRSYPNGSLAAHVLGGVSLDDKGQAGVEYAYNESLQGKKGQALIMNDARRREYYFETLAAAVPGRDVDLTVDETLQYITERELAKVVRGTLANWGTVIVSRPDSGEILAMASYPTYDPNFFSSAGTANKFNRAIQHTYEPGSTFKIVTASAALARHLVRLEETFDCSKADLDIPGKPIRDHKSYGILTFPEVVINSSDRGIAQVVKRVGSSSLYEMASAFGYGRKTGIGLAGEEAGKLRPVSAWTGRTMYALAMGYEVAATPLQILQAVNVLANRGYLVPPRIVMPGSDPSDPLKIRAAPTPVRVLPAETAAALTGILERAVQEGTGTEARVEGYKIAGKTGTSQKWDPGLKNYSSRRHTASFVGFVPADKPALSIIVVIDDPKGTEYYGGEVAAPVFREIAKRCLLQLGIYPTEPAAKRVIIAQLQREAAR